MTNAKSKKKKVDEKESNAPPSSSALIICRNKYVRRTFAALRQSRPPLPQIFGGGGNEEKKKDKQTNTEERGLLKQLFSSAFRRLLTLLRHWRYISSFHGPWLQLPPEVLESLAHSNYQAPRPRPIDPAVLYDLVKIRRLIDDATNLAVRAASGIASSTVLKDGGLLGGSAAGVLGLGIVGGGPAPRLSRERKHRMRELATQKLAKAYKLDEIAASVATMQSASSLEEVANLVLSRNPNDPDAKYVHFFHEKIPSRMLAKCTSLKPLDDVISERPAEGAPLRTRAVTKGFKDDFIGAAQDLTHALNISRPRSLHDLGMEVATRGAGSSGGGGSNGTPRRTEEEDQPSSLEAQLLFHRASTYLTIACQNIEATLIPKANASAVPEEAAQAEALKREAAKKAVRTNAKRALRDYIKFLSTFDYTPGLPPETTEEFMRSVEREVSKASDLNLGNTRSDTKKFLEILYRQTGNGGHQPHTHHHHTNMNNPLPPTLLPQLPVYQVSALFTSPQPSTLPPYPSASLITTNGSSRTSTPNSTPRTSTSSTLTAAATALLADGGEAITYHPLLTDALHSLILCHVLIQTPTKEILRHAHMVARLARICDGYPIFLSPRSPARADWIEVLRRTNNFVGLESTWEALCSPAPLPGSPPSPIGDGDVSLELERAAAALVGGGRVMHQHAPPVQPKRWAQEDGGKEYPISTDRAAVVSRWVREGVKRERERLAVAALAKDSAHVNSSGTGSPVTPTTPMVEGVEELQV
ncbi:unnamed protein product [Tuber melanosporum]|uniref:(Perigord truffle) hypothetical protein n=1 Tax=Tuber melanosporum (strain Mel28) TaxID=656061 RepID=D5GJX9_TUBMM|nr:uncharacterized protein GSTUM_00009262001 [Tuber melanosporum]CAZ84822.1 unnamed protein product [Tuber melanosporum]